MISKELIGRKGEVWLLDDSLREKAKELVEKFSGRVGFIVPQRVVFVRVVGLKAKWLGKCFYLALPKTLVPFYVVNTLLDMGLVKQEELEGAGIDDSALDVNYIIAINDDLLTETESDESARKKLEEVVLLHELCHIKPEFDGLIKHDIEDFAFVLDTFGVHWTSGNFEDGCEDSESD